MANIEIYKNYGCLAAEKRNIYTYGGQAWSAVCSDTMTVEIPEDWELAENEAGEEFVIAPWGWAYGINDVLDRNDIPYFKAIYNNQLYKKELKIIK